MQPSCPPAAQLLYDLGLEAEMIPVTSTGPAQFDTEVSHDVSTPPMAPWPPTCPVLTTCKWVVPPRPQMLPLPLRETALPHLPIAAVAACLRVPNPIASEIATEYNITCSDLATVYMSPDPFFGAFEEDIDLRKWSYDKHRTAGLALVEYNGRVSREHDPKLTWCKGG